MVHQKQDRTRKSGHPHSRNTQDYPPERFADRRHRTAVKALRTTKAALYLFEACEADYGVVMGSDAMRALREAAEKVVEECEEITKQYE